MYIAGAQSYFGSGYLLSMLLIPLSPLCIACPCHMSLVNPLPHQIIPFMTGSLSHSSYVLVAVGSWPNGPPHLVGKWPPCICCVFLVSCHTKDEQRMAGVMDMGMVMSSSRVYEKKLVVLYFAISS